MPSYPCFDAATWYLKYLGLPLTVIIAMFRLCRYYSENKRRDALEGKVVVITGASSGIGEALAHAFYEQGSKLVLAARRENELNRVKQDLLAKTITVTTKEPVIIPLDLMDLDNLESFVQKVYDTCGYIDILINNGGISHRGSILHTNMNVFKQIMCVNYFGSVGLTKAVLPKMVENKSGHIVFISSIQGLIAIPERSAYASAKHAIQAFADSLRSEMKQHCVNVTVVSPGYVKTAVSLNALTGSGEAHAVMDKNTAEGFTAEYTAMKIMDAIVYKEKELVISQFMPRLGVFLRHFAPSVYFHFTAKRANKT